MTERRNRNCSQHSGKDFVFYEISSNNNMPPRAHVLRIITKFPQCVSSNVSSAVPRALVVVCTPLVLKRLLLLLVASRPRLSARMLQYRSATSSKTSVAPAVFVSSLV